MWRGIPPKKKLVRGATRLKTTSAREEVRKQVVGRAPSSKVGGGGDRARRNKVDRRNKVGGEWC